MTWIFWPAVVVMALLGINALYVAAEFALIGSRRAKLEQMARTGRPAARRVLAITSDLRSLDRSVTTAQAGITAASLALGMYGEHAIAEAILPMLGDAGAGAMAASHGLASLIAVAGLTILHVVLGELVPKSIALQHPAATALLTEPPLRLTRVVLGPLVTTLDVASLVILRLLGARPAAAAARAHTVEEIETVIEESGRHGVLAAPQAEILVNLLAVEELPVRKVMVPRTRVFGLAVSDSPDAVLARLRETEHTRYAVYDGDLDHILGYVHVKDLMRAFDGVIPFDLRQLVRPIPVIPETATCARLFRLFRKRRVQIALVVDEHGGTAGMATLEDLVEEIFGEVQDEFDAEEPPIRRVSERIALVRGEARLDELNEALGLTLEEADVDTVGGLVVKRLGRTARVGDEVRLRGAVLTVEAVEGLAVARVRVERPGVTGPGRGHPPP